jgi:glutamyl-tRNA synthetase
MTNPTIKPVRVRIAPSPTGFFHIGTARTALFNWLFARHLGGKFIVRIEDTDKERSTKEFEKNILEGISWLGLDYDEGPLPDGTSKGDFGPYRQTERLGSYEKYLKQLLAKEKAYYCFCTKEVLEEERTRQEKSGVAPKYAGTCANISKSDAEARIAKGESAVIRLKVAPVKVTFTDHIRGEVTFDNALTGDIVIAKNLREPLYNFAVVIDDYEMQISHVIRGEDHVANTPKQIAIADALGFPKLEYAHLPLILNADRSKMSKRFNATSIDEYRAKGYLPEAMMNFLALLGWHPAEKKQEIVKEGQKISEETEVMGKEELQKEFDISRVQKGGAIFNLEKLNYFNKEFLKKMADTEIRDRIIKESFDFRRGQELWSVNGKPQKSPGFEIQPLAIIHLFRERAVTLLDFIEFGAELNQLPEYDPKILVWKKGSVESAKANLAKAKDLLSEISGADFTKQVVEPKIMSLAEVLGKGDLLWPVRVAVSGKEQSPAPVDILVALGKEESLRRLEIAIKKLN